MIASGTSETESGPILMNDLFNEMARLILKNSVFGARLHLHCATPNWTELNWTELTCDERNWYDLYQKFPE